MTSGRFLIVTTDRTSLEEANSQGDVLWKRDFGTVITAIDVTSNELVVGLLDGSLVLLGKDGRESFAYSPGGSRVPVIYGVGLAPDARYIAVVSGLSPQRFTLLERRDVSYRPARVLDLPEGSRQRVFLHIFAGIPYVYYEAADGLRYFALRDSQAGTLPLQGGQVVDVAPGVAPYVYVLSTQTTIQFNAELQIVNPPGQVVARLSFPGRGLYLRPLGRSILVGSDHELSRLDLVER